MNLIEQFSQMLRIDAIINRKGTGTAQELAERLGISRRSVFNYLDKLRCYGAEIDYCPVRKSFFYVNDKRPQLPIISKQNANKIQGGESFYNFFPRVQVFCTPTFDLCNKLINTEELNDASGFRFSGLGY
jgi:biotin operon repressor